MASATASGRKCNGPRQLNVVQPVNSQAGDLPSPKDLPTGLVVHASLVAQVPPSTHPDMAVAHSICH